MSSPAEEPWPIHWYGLDTFNASNSEPGLFEKDPQPHYTRFKVRAAPRGQGAGGQAAEGGSGRTLARALGSRGGPLRDLPTSAFLG